MTRLERKELTKKTNRNNKIISISMIVLIVNIVLLIIIGVTDIVPRPDPDVMSETAISIFIFSLLLLILSPLFTGMWFLMKTQHTQIIYTRESRRILMNREKIRVGLFWDAVKVRDFEKAKKIYNYDNYITTHSFRALCNGVIIGSLKMYGEIDDWKETSDERMMGYLELS